MRFLETPARSDVTLAMDRMLDHVARDTKRPKLAEPEDDKGPTVADLAAYLVSRGGNEQRRSSKLAKASPQTGGHLEFPSNGWRRAAPGLVSRASYEHLSAARLV